jgi:peptidoglycan/LPS O-acetylase OafA/YrhL
VEEQFYVIWPSLLWLAGISRSTKLALIVVVLGPCIRLAMLISGANESAMTREFQAIADSLATGCILAVYFNQIAAQRFVVRAIQSHLFLAIPIFGLALSVAFGKEWYYVCGQSIANVAIAAAIFWVLRSKRSWLTIVLNSRGVVWCGVLSYSLYLWQEPFLNVESTAIYTTFPVNLCLTVAFAIASYAVIERPFLRLKVSAGAPSTASTVKDG